MVDIEKLIDEEVEAGHRDPPGTGLGRLTAWNLIEEIKQQLPNEDAEECLRAAQESFNEAIDGR